MRKNFYLSGLFLCILALCICGCGSGGGSAADPMATGTVRFVDGTGSIITTAEVAPNGTITLRAMVTNTRSDGTSVPVVNEKVSFSIVNSGNGGSLAASSDRTGSDGTATCLFTSGNSMYSDQVRVTTSVGATASIYINKVSGTPDPYIKTIESSAVGEVVAGQTSVITINVVNGAGNPVAGVYVRFRLTVNGSGAVFADASTDGNFYTYTDSGGNATAVYRAGGTDPYNDAYDSVLAELENGSSKAVEIKRAAGTAPEPTDELSATLAAAPTSVAAGLTSIITATVTGDEKAGAEVTFTIPVNNSGAAFINSGGFAVNTITVTASGTGIATVIYRAGALLPDDPVQDTVQALLENGANAAIILTRTAAATPSAYSVTVTPSATTVSAGQVSIITAVVTKTDDTGAAKAAPGETVNFTLPVNSSFATLSAATATTDSSGKAVVIYRPGSTTVNVQDTVQAAVGTAVAAEAITVKGSSVSSYSIEIQENSPKIPLAGGSVVITAKVTNNAGETISGMLVNFAVTGGAGVVAPLAVTTGGNGLAVAVYTNPAAGAAGNMAGVVTAGVIAGTYTDAVVVMY